MKLPRCLDMSVLRVSVLAVLAVPAWWWVTWPETRVRSFFDTWSDDPAIATDSITLTSTLSEFENYLLVEWTRIKAPAINRGTLQLKALPRTMTDLIMGREAFEVPETGVLIGAERNSLLVEQPEIDGLAARRVPPYTRFSDREWLRLVL
jgi:hypothetical protein